MIRLEMNNYNLILPKKQQKYYPEKHDKYECLIGKKILSSDQIRITEQANIPYSPLGKVLKST